MNSMRTKSPWKFLLIIAALAGLSYGGYYVSQRIGGNDVVVGYSTSSAWGAENDAINTLDAKYSSYEIVDKNSDTSGVSTEHGYDPINIGSYATKHGTWKCTIRVKRAVKR
jgi:hypothetical protein